MSESAQMRAKCAIWHLWRDRRCVGECITCNLPAVYLVYADGRDGERWTYHLCIRHGTLEYLERAIRAQERVRR